MLTEVVGVASMKDPGSRTGGRAALWAWVAVVLAPVGLLASIALGFTSGEGDGSAGREIAGVLLVLLSLALPTAAVYLATVAARSGHASGRGAVVVSGLELVLILVGLPTLVVATNVFFIALVIYLVALAIGLAYARGRSSRA